MTLRGAALSGLATGALVLLAAWALEWPLERVVLLAPVLVIGAGAVAGLAVLWARVVAESLRRGRRPLLWLGVGLAAVGLIAALSLLGVQLPRE
jgi:hypothetical protein